MLYHLYKESNHVVSLHIHCIKFLFKKYICKIICHHLKMKLYKDHFSKSYLNTVQLNK